MTLVFIFDVGGVLLKWSNNDPIYHYISKKYNVKYNLLRNVMIQRLPDLESGKISINEYVSKALAKVGRTMRSGDTGHSLMYMQFKKLAKLRKGTVRIIKNLQHKNYPVYALSNTSKTHLNHMKKSGWTKIFDGFYASCELGSVKPQVGIYKKVLKDIGIEPTKIVYIDDNPDNIAGAKLSGLHYTIRFQSLKQLKNDLNRTILNDVDQVKI